MSYVTGTTIKALREKNQITQKELAERINISDKTVSKWETGRGLPDIGIIEDLAKALRVSIAELLTADYKENENGCANINKMHFYICPVCGNIVAAVGRGMFSCCGIELPECEAKEPDGSHSISIDTAEDEYVVSLSHPMDKKHYISFVAYTTLGSVEIVKLYPQQDVSVRFKKKGHGSIYAYCNKHGMFKAVV